MIGQLDPAILDALLETLPLEFSVVDRNDEVLAWNKHETRIFKRPRGVLGRNVRNCHPKRSIELVARIIEEMKAGTRNKARFWIDMPLGPSKEPQKILIEYYALRDAKGAYLGCLEASQNIAEIQGLTGQKRLLDEA
ncbi:MAG: PAS domain-containing protein [Candidatus Eisenbacteria sp.]|nr:PAS domain-containing protein [Candidatus Eisenbacteria bacterium]